MINLEIFKDDQCVCILACYGFLLSQSGSLIVRLDFDYPQKNLTNIKHELIINKDQNFIIFIESDKFTHIKTTAVNI